MTDQMISIANTKQGDFTGYLSLPPSGKGAGIIMLQEIFGVNSTMRAAADRFAKEGYTVLVPDLFWRIQPGLQLGYEGEDLEKAFNHYRQYHTNEGVKDLGLAIEILKKHPACSGKVGVLGFCLGGKLAYLAAAAHKVDVAVSFYGTGIVDYLSLANSIQCPLQMHFGEKDEMISKEQVTRIKKAFKGREEVDIHVYPEVGPAFYHRTRSSYAPEAAALADERTLPFLENAFIRSGSELAA